MQKWILVALITMLPTLAFSADATPSKSVVLKGISCGGRSVLTLIDGVWSLVPFIGNPRFIYNDLQGQGEQLLRRQARFVGIDDEDAGFIGIHVGVMSPVLDAVMMGVAWTAYGYETLKSKISKKPIPSDVIATTSHFSSFPNSRGWASQSLLMGSEAVEACKDMIAKLRDVPTTKASYVYSPKSSPSVSR